MITLNTIPQNYSFDFDFDDLTATCSCDINGIDLIINFNFDFNIIDVEHSKGDYFTPDAWSYEFEYDVDDIDAYYFLDNNPFRVTEHHRQTIKDLIESDIKNHIDENELYKH